MGNVTGKKFGGRVKGTPNKDNKIKLFIKELFDNNQDKLIEEINKLSGKSYIDSMLALLEYIQPKLSRTEVKAEVDSNVEVQTIEFIGLNENKIK